MNGRLLSALCIFGVFAAPSIVWADYFEYNVICIPTQINHVQRVITNTIYLALKGDNSIAKSSVTVRVRKMAEVVETRHGDELLDGLGFFFDPSDLSLSLGGTAAGESCFADATVSVNVSAVRKDGSSTQNSFSTIIQLPGAYATKKKIRIRE